MKWRGVFVNLAVALIFALPCMAAVISAAVPPATRADGYTVTASTWNSDVGGIYSYINNNIVPALNKLTARGDLYIYDGSNLQALAIGADGTALTANSAAANGANWAVLANTTQLTTKGDLLTYGASAVRLGVGSDGKLLTVRSSATEGIAWETSSSSIPTGSIIAWSPFAAGTSTVPSGWLLCDGSSSTPNLIGKFIIGTRTATSTSAAAAGGYGIYTVDANAGGAVNHTHSLPAASGSTSNGASSTATAASSPGAFTASTFSHVHTFTAPSGTSGATTSEPSDYALVYIMKQ